MGFSFLFRLDVWQEHTPNEWERPSRSNVVLVRKKKRISLFTDHRFLHRRLCPCVCFMPYTAALAFIDRLHILAAATKPPKLTTIRESVLCARHTGFISQECRNGCRSRSPCVRVCVRFVAVHHLCDFLVASLSKGRVFLSTNL